MLSILPMPLNELLAMIASAAVFITAIFIALTTIETRKNVKATERIVQSSVASRSGENIEKMWDEVYSMKNDLLKSTITTLSDLQTIYQTDYARYLSSEEWGGIRRLCAFFEQIGLDLYYNEKYLNKKDLFNRITVDVFKDKNGPVPEGVIYARLKGHIDYLRLVYRHDIYEFYDHFLLPEYKRYMEESEKHPLVPGQLRKFCK